MAEINLFDASLLPALFISLMAGVISFLSPCVLPIVPPYLAYMGGISVSDMEGDRTARRRVLVTSVFFVLGLSTIFILLGFTASTFGRFFLANQDTFTLVAGLLVMVFGAHFLGVIRIGFLSREARIDAGDQGGTGFGAYLLGLAFAFGWTPCIGPILSAILSLAASEGSVPRGTALLAVYALGLGLPFIAVAAFFPRLKGFMALMRKHMEKIERIMGLLLWTIGLMMATGQFTDLALWLNEAFPVLQQFG